MTIQIYGLREPSSDTVWYVGKTAKSIEERMKEHLYSTDGKFKSEWIRGLRERGTRPEVILIETCGDDEWREREQYWIEYHRGLNPDLTNGENHRDEDKPRKTTKLWRSTIDNLRWIIKLQPLGKEESQIELVDRLVKQELERVKGNGQHSGYTP